MNEIVRFRADNGASVEITPKDVIDYLCPNATAQEVGLFLQLCSTQRLNPWTGEAFLVKYAEDKPAQIVTGKETFTKRASANPDYEGFEAGVVYTDVHGQVRQREGSAVYPSAGEALVGGWCRVYVRGKRPFYDEVSLSEYSTGRSLWRSKPATMVRKVALVHCLREAFPDAFAGLFSAEELGREEQAESMGVVPESVAPMPAQAGGPASAEACAAIDAKIVQLADLRGVPYERVYDAVFGSKLLQALGFDNEANSAEFTADQAGAALGLLDNWITKAEQEADQPEYETE